VAARPSAASSGRVPATRGVGRRAIAPVEAVRKVYGRLTAVEEVSVRVARGEIIGLLGPNGAGETTLIDMILGVLEPTAGTIRIEELEVRTHRSRAVERTSFAAAYATLPGNLPFARTCGSSA